MRVCGNGELQRRLRRSFRHGTVWDFTGDKNEKTEEFAKFKRLEDRMRRPALFFVEQTVHVCARRKEDLPIARPKTEDVQ